MMATAPAWTAVIEEIVIKEITFTELPNVMVNPKFYIIAGILIPREAFVGFNSGKSHIINMAGGWDTKMLPRDLSLEATVEARMEAEADPGVILFKAGPTPSSESTIEIWIRAAAVKSIVERKESSFIK